MSLAKDARAREVPLVRTTERIVRDGRLVVGEGVVMVRSEAERYDVLDSCEEYDGPLTAAAISTQTGRPLPGLRTSKVPAPETTAASSGRSPSPPPSSATGSEFPRAVGGGWYELSNGERVRGKAEAQEAEAALEG